MASVGWRGIRSSFREATFSSAYQGGPSVNIINLREKVAKNLCNDNKTQFLLT